MIKNPLTKFLTGFAAQMTRYFVPNQPAPAADAAQAKPKPAVDLGPLVVSYDYERALGGFVLASQQLEGNSDRKQLAQDAELALFRMTRANPEMAAMDAAKALKAASPQFAELILERASAALTRLHSQKIDLLKQPLLQPELLTVCADKLGEGLDKHKAHSLLTVVTMRLKHQNHSRVLGLTDLVQAGSSTAKLLGNLVARPFNALARVAQPEPAAAPLPVNPGVRNAWKDVVTDISRGLALPPVGLSTLRYTKQRQQHRAIAAQLREEMQNGDTVPMPLEPSRRAVGAPPAHVPVVLREELPAAVLRRAPVLART